MKKVSRNAVQTIKLTWVGACERVGMVLLRGSKVTVAEQTREVLKKLGFKDWWTD